jgi:Spy/CpxP family protein refolding chaperone
MRAVWLVVLALLATSAAAAAQVGGADQDRRAELERQFRRQFMAQVAQRLDLTTDQRDRMREVLAARAEDRRDLALESQALRIELIQAVRDEDAAMSRFEDILTRLEALRAREREIEAQEEAEMAEILDPRQRAIFLMLRMQLNDRVRQMRGPGPRAEGPPGTGGPFI